MGKLQVGQDRLRVLVVDGWASFAEALSVLLGRLGIEAEHASAAEAGSRAGALRPDVLLLGADTLPWQTATSCAAAVREHVRDVPLLVLTAQPRERAERLIVRLAPASWASRDGTPEALVAAITAAARGGRASVLPGGDSRSEKHHPSPVQALTPREQDVLRAMIAGGRTSAIAAWLGISPHTVRTHVQNILGKLNVRSRFEAATIGRRCGLVPLPEQSAAGVVER